MAALCAAMLVALVRSTGFGLRCVFVVVPAVVPALRGGYFILSPLPVAPHAHSAAGTMEL
jgi:hypothetical protein